MKRKLVTIMMTMALATTLVACKNTDTNAESNSEPISNSEFVMQNAELETKEPTELETKESKEVESKETTEATKETETEVETEEATEETESTESKETENKEETTKKEENTTSSKKENTSKTENTSKKNEVKNDTSKKNEASSNTEVNNNTSNNNSNNANTEASNNTPAPAPAPAPEPACTHPQTYINSGMFLRRESLGGGCYKDIEAAEDVCLTCGAVVRSYERVGQEVHANMKRISGDAKAPTCTEGGYDNTVTACDCGSETHTNNYTEPAYGHAYHDDCTGDISEDKTKVRYITVCYRCGDVANEWWE